MYESMPHYQQRQSAAIDVMSSQLGAVPPYMQQSGQPGLQMQPSSSHYGSSQAEQSQYPAAGVQRGTVPSQYSSGSVDYSMVESQPSQLPTQPPPPSAAEQQALQEELRQYEQQLRSTFEAIIAGRVTDASDQIIPISRWLTSNVVPLGKCSGPIEDGSVLINLGLHHDGEPTQYEERLNLWRQFNLCWEALGQKQKDITEQTLQTGRQPPDILSAETIRRLVDDLVTMCDQIDNYGLVDYEIGVAEEQICAIFTLCLDLLQRDGQEPQPVQSTRPP